MSTPRNKAAEKVANPAAGLKLLMDITRDTMTIESCGQYVVKCVTHPLKLDFIPPRDFEHRKRNIMITRTPARGQVPEVMLALIRFWIGPSPENKVRKLRVISVYDPKTTSMGMKHHFFEVQTATDCIIAGETEDFTAPGKAAFADLEDIFALLSIACGVEIKRHLMPLSLQTLEHEILNQEAVAANA